MNKIKLFTNERMRVQQFGIRLLLVMLLLPLLLTVLPVSPVSAGLRSCRGDPKFFLSNGAKITATVTVNTDVSNVSNANYILHAPKGLKVDHIVFTAARSGIPETAQVKFDQPAGKYWLDIVVTTKVSEINVIANGSLRAESVITTSGVNAQHLIITLR